VVRHIVDYKLIMKKGVILVNMLDELIEALQIFRKYGNLVNPTHCSHDLLTVMIDPELVSEEDKKRLDELGFFVGEEFDDCFTSFRFGSA
jgi:hypothetical protein